MELRKDDTVNVAEIVCSGPSGEYAEITSCDDMARDAVPVTTRDAPPGTVDIEPGQTYKTPGGSGIIWNVQTNIIIVCEPGGDFWSITGTPPILTDGAGISQNIPTIGAYFPMVDGSKLIVSESTAGGKETKARVFLPGTPVNATTLAGYDCTQTTIYNTNADFSKISAGTLC